MTRTTLMRLTWFTCLMASASGLSGCGEWHGAADELTVPESAVETEEGRLARDSSQIDPGDGGSDPLPRADVVTGTLESLPGSGLEVDGQVYLAQEVDATTVAMQASGLRPTTEYVARLGPGPCREDVEARPGDITLGFTADGDGATDATVTADTWVADDAPVVSVVAADGGSAVACAVLDPER